MASVRQRTSVGLVLGNPLVTFGLPVLSTSYVVVYESSRGQPITLSGPGWNFNAGLIATAATPNDQHMAGYAGPGVVSGASFSSVLVAGSTAGGQLCALELAGVGAPRQTLMTGATQNAQPCTLGLPGPCLDGSLILGLFTMKPPDGVGQTGVPDAGWTEELEVGGGGLHPWSYAASRVAVGAGVYVAGVTSVYAWTGDFGAGYAGTAFEFPAAAPILAYPGEPGGGVW